MHGKVAFRSVFVDGRHYLFIRVRAGVRRQQATWRVVPRGESQPESRPQLFHASRDRHCVQRQCPERRKLKRPGFVHLRLEQSRSRRHLFQRRRLCWHLERAALHSLQSRRHRHSRDNRPVWRNHQRSHPGLRSSLYCQHSGQHCSAGQFSASGLPRPDSAARCLHTPLQGHKFLPFAEPDTHSAGQRV
jgi:hypothetical protein